MDHLVVSVNGDNRVVYQEFRYKDIIVPKGFTFNGNSIPRFFRWFLGKYEYLEASCVHDYLYTKQSNDLEIEKPKLYKFTGRNVTHWYYKPFLFKINRKDADKIYKSILIELGCPALKAYICYLFIRLFGQLYYKAH
ncbi:DUF1353 domain-containing protein [Francisella philomiragia]|uniref:DUF1353 domain-containing protein n=1 Tax=Francisella philomiragia TaxID=28110 RepID=A0ABS1GCW3_9GAMM|nr:DUF1353 domain-containing protein [Francisella philomiragia]MBK2258992.1 DUF1353 domain-containing protein [Francisella philomiragia]MBK2302683.1 DUF1353 domain-containing protein [Francisella philomiragia]